MGKEDSEQIGIEDLEIAPLWAKSQLKGAFSNEDDPDFQSLVTWLKTWAFICQREKKCKTYLIHYRGVLIGYVTVSSLVVKLNLPGVPDSSALQPNYLLLGKLYVARDYRSAGIGSHALNFVVSIALSMNEIIGCQAIIVDANNNDRTINFYRRYGFEILGSHEDELRMYFLLPKGP